MKMFKNYIKTICIFISLTILTTLIITLLRFNTNLTLNTLNIIKSISSIIIFLFASIINGKLNKKRGLINGLIMTSIFLLFVLILKVFNQEIIVSSMIIKILIIIIGNIIGVNI